MDSYAVVLVTLAVCLLFAFALHRRYNVEAGFRSRYFTFFLKAKDGPQRTTKDSE